MARTADSTREAGGTSTKPATLPVVRVDAGETYVTRTITLPAPGARVVTVPVTLPVTRIVTLPATTPVETGGGEETGEEAGEEEKTVSTSRPPDYLVGEIPAELIEELKQVIQDVEKLYNKLASLVPSEHFSMLYVAKTWLNEARFIVEDYEKREGKNLTRDWVEGEIEEGGKLKQALEHMISELTANPDKYSGLSEDQLVEELRKRRSEIEGLLNNDFFKSLPSSDNVKSRLFSTKAAIDKLLSSRYSMTGAAFRRAARNLLAEADSTISLAKYYANLGLTFDSELDLEFYLATNYGGITLASVLDAIARLKAVAPYLKKEHYEELYNSLVKLKEAFEKGDKKYVVENGWIVPYVNIVYDKVKSKVDATELEKNYTYFIANPDASPPTEAKARWRLDEITGYALLPGKVGEYVHQAFDKLAEKTGQQWLKYVGAYWGQLVGFAAIALTFELAGLATGGVATPLLAGAALYQAWEEYFAYPATDPKAAEELNLFMEKLRQKDPTTWATIAGMVAGAILGYYVAKSLPGVKVKGVPLEQRIREPIYKKLIELAEKADMEGYTYAAELLRGLAWRYAAKVKAVKVLEYESENMKLTVYVKDGYAVIELLDKGKAKAGKAEYITMGWGEEVSATLLSTERNLEGFGQALRKLVSNAKNAEEAKIALRMVDDIIDLVREAGLESKSAEQLINSLLRGEIDRAMIYETGTSQGVVLKAAGNTYVYLREGGTPLVYRVAGDFEKVRQGYSSTPAIEIEPVFKYAKGRITGTPEFEAMSNFTLEQVFDLLQGITEKVYEVNNLATTKARPLIRFLGEKNLYFDLSTRRVFAFDKGTIVRETGEGLVYKVGDETIRIDALYERTFIVTKDLRYVNKEVLKIRLPEARGIDLYGPDLIKEAMELLKQGEDTSRVVGYIARKIGKYSPSAGSQLRAIADQITRMAEMLVERGVEPKDIVILAGPDGAGATISIRVVTSTDDLGKMVDLLSQKEAQYMLGRIGTEYGLPEEKLYSMSAQELARITGLNVYTIEALRLKAQYGDVEIYEVPVTVTSFIEVPAAATAAVSKTIYVEDLGEVAVSAEMPVQEIRLLPPLFTYVELPPAGAEETVQVYVERLGEARGRLDIPVADEKVAGVVYVSLPASTATVYSTIYTERLDERVERTVLPLVETVSVGLDYLELPGAVVEETVPLYVERLDTLRSNLDVPLHLARTSEVVYQEVPGAEETVYATVYREQATAVGFDVDIPLSQVAEEDRTYIGVPPPVVEETIPIYITSDGVVTVSADVPVSVKTLGELVFIPLQGTKKTVWLKRFMFQDSDYTVEDRVETVVIPVEKTITMVLPVYRVIYAYAGQPPPGEKPPPPPPPVQFPMLPPGFAPAGSAVKATGLGVRRGKQYEVVRL